MRASQVALLDLSKTVIEDDKVPRCLSSTRKRGGLDFDKDKFLLDVSEIREFNSVEDRPDDIQLSQEITPKARQTKQEAVRTPVKSVSVIPKKKRRLLPKTSTVLFVTGCTGDLDNRTPSLSAITSSQNTECLHENKDVTKDGPVKRTKCSSGEKHFFRSGPNSIWKEDTENPGKILTSTPVSSTQTRFQRPEVNLTCVPRPCFEDELEINESIEVNSDEIVPEDLTKEDIFTEEVTILPEKHKGCERKNSQKTPEKYRKLVSISSSKTAHHVKSSVKSALESVDTSFCKKLSVKPITKSSMVSKITECYLTDPSVAFPHKKSICYGKTSQEMFRDRTGLSEDILLTHNFKRR
ncbi:uncharacterized protein LOC117324620 [Pecten maximus]|uniref:uncharacterized protein LOC117324620 n=1 Tax=Pecten maximus TaxID=6579 RepID=UPI0014580FDB|nr:uncharacterized protein LOC117324620 [Pecten maximus]